MGGGGRDSCVPAVLGHGGLATTDVPFTATFLLALLALLRWIEEPTRGRAIAAGLALGLAGATKFSALVLPVIAVLAALARRSLGPRSGSARRLLAQAPLAAVGAMLVVWAAYRFAVAAPATLWQPEWLQETVTACFPSARAARRRMAARSPAAGAGAFLAALGLCAQEAPGRSTAYLLGHLTQDGFRRSSCRDCGQAAPAPGRAGDMRIRRDPARTRDARAALRALWRPCSRCPPPPWRW